MSDPLFNPVANLAEKSVAGGPATEHNPPRAAGFQEGIHSVKLSDRMPYFLLDQDVRKSLPKTHPFNRMERLLRRLELFQKSGIDIDEVLPASRQSYLPVL